MAAATHDFASGSWVSFKDRLAAKVALAARADAFTHSKDVGLKLAEDFAKRAESLKDQQARKRRQGPKKPWTGPRGPPAQGRGPPRGAPPGRDRPKGGWR